MPGGAAEFIVGAEVRPRGSGLRDMARDTKLLTEETRKSGEETRRVKTSLTELEQAERRRRSTLDQMTQAIRAQNLALAQAKVDISQYQRQVEQAAAAKRNAISVLGQYRTAILAAAAAAAAFAAVAIVRSILQQASAYEQLRIQLRTVTGSAESAANAFDMIKRFAVATPFEVSNITAAFVRLKAVGIEPTEGLLRSLGDTASAFGRDITDFTAAVIGATAGEMEMLKSFGVIAHVQGDQVKFTFQGVTTQIHRDSASIVGYLKTIGDTKFAGGMERQAKSMQGAISNVKDAFAAFADAVGRAGVTEAIAHLATTITAAFSGTDEAARTFGAAIVAAVKLVEMVFTLAVRAAWLLVAVMQVLLALKVASWFVTLTSAIAAATGATVTFKGVLSSLAIAGPLALIGVALLAAIVLMERYIITTRAAHAAEMEKVARSQELFTYYQQLRANKIGLTETEAAYSLEVRKTMETERAALVLSLERSKAKLQAARRDAGGALGIDWAPEMADDVAELEREIQSIDNMLNGLGKEWDRLGKLPMIKLPVDPGDLDKAAKKLADLLAGFARAAEQAERIQAEQASGGASGVARVTAEIERQNAAYQALHSMEKLSAAAKARLTGIIEGLVGRTQAANRATAEGAAETARDLAFTNAASEAEARLADAKSQTAIASREAAIQAEADAIARDNLKEGDAEYVAGLLRVIRTREDYLAVVAQEIAVVERQIAQAAAVRQKQAEFTDAQEQSSAATRRLAVELEAETQARARGIQIGGLSYLMLLAFIAVGKQEIAVLDQRAAAQKRLNDAQAAQSRARAEFTDWMRQRDAAAAYGSEIAGVLQSYGLLSDATRDLAIHEEALAISREAGNTQTVEQIEAQLRGYAAVGESLARVSAAIEMQAYVIQPGIDALHQMGETLQSEVIDRIISGNLDFDDLWKSMARTFLQAVAEMLKRWIIAHHAMQAEAARTAAVNAAAAQAGGGGGAVNAGTAGIGTNLAGGTGTYAAGGGSGAGMGTAASLGAVVAIYAAIYFGVSSWIKSHKEHIAEVTFQLQQDAGGLVSQTYGNTAATRAITQQVTDAGLAVVDWIKSLGGEVTTAVGTAAAQLTIGRKGQGKNTSWYVLLANGVKEMFASQEEAFGFAMVEALRQAEISGLDPIVVAAIKRNTFKTMEELQEGIADAIKVASFGHAAVAADFRGVTAEMDRLRASMREMIGTGSELEEALSRINAQEVLLLQSQRDAITGKQRTAEEEYKMRLLEAQAWNAERGVRLANIQVQILDTQTRIANYKASKLLIGGGSAGGGPGGESGSGGLLGIGRTIYWLAGVIATSQAVMEGSGDAQLDALTGYLASLQALYNALAAMPPIDPSEVPYPNAGKGGGGGAGGGDRKQARLDLMEEVRGWKLTDLGRQLADTTRWFDDFKASLKGMGFTAKQQADLLAAAAEELERRRQALKATQMQASQDFINAGAAAGGPLMKGLADNRKTQLDLIQANRDLQKQGLLSQREMRELNKAIHEAGVRQRDAMIQSAAGQLFLDLYGLLGDEKEAAQLRFDLTVMELELRREELRLAMLTAGYTEERMNAILGPLGILIQRVKDAGPGIFTGGGGGGGGGPTPPAFQGTTVGQERWRDGIKWRWNGSAWIQVGTYGGGGGDSGGGSNDNSAAESLRQQYRNAGKNEYQLALEQVQSDFATLRATFGDTAELAELFGAAMERLRTQFLEGVQDFYDQLAGGALGGATVEQQYNSAMANYQRLLLAVQGGDLSQANALAQAGQDLVNLAGQMWGTSTGGFVGLRDMILEQLRALLGITAPPVAPGVQTNPEGMPSGGLNYASNGPNYRSPVERGPSAGEDKQRKATEAVGTAVDLAARKNERLLTRIAEALDRLDMRERAETAQKPPLTYGQGNR